MFILTEIIVKMAFFSFQANNDEYLAQNEYQSWLENNIYWTGLFLR